MSLSALLRFSVVAVSVLSLQAASNASTVEAQMQERQHRRSLQASEFQNSLLGKGDVGCLIGCIKADFSFNINFNAQVSASGCGS